MQCESASTSLTAVQVYFSYGLGNGWQVISNPKIEYDWEGASGNRWSVPLGLGVSKTFRPRKAPLKIDLELQNYVKSPEAFGPEWLLKFTVTPAFKNPFQN